MKYLYLLFFILTFTIPKAHAFDIRVLLSDNSKEYQDVGLSLHTSLTDEISDATIHVQQLNEFNSRSLLTTDLIITVGNKAALEIANSQLRIPVIYGFSDTEVLPKQGNWVGAVISQPLARVSRIVDPLLKNQFKSRILVAYSHTNRSIHSQIEALPELQNGTFDIVKIQNDEKPAKYIEDKLFNAGALLAVNDSFIWRGENARWMLYQAYRYKVPVIGYSKSFLKAGALASVYSTQSQITHTIVEQAVYFAQNSKFSQQGIVYSDYNIEYNKNIARALKINVPADRLGVDAEQ